MWVFLKLEFFLIWVIGILEGVLFWVSFIDLLVLCLVGFDVCFWGWLDFFVGDGGCNIGGYFCRDLVGDVDFLGDVDLVLGLECVVILILGIWLFRVCINFMCFVIFIWIVDLRGFLVCKFFLFEFFDVNVLWVVGVEEVFWGI